MPSHDFTLNGPLGHFYPNVIPGAKIGGIPRRVSQFRTIESIAQARLHGLGTSERKQEEELSETRPPDGPEKGLAVVTTRSNAKKAMAAEGHQGQSGSNSSEWLSRMVTLDRLSKRRAFP